jgi:hypothetical protein
MQQKNCNGYSLPLRNCQSKIVTSLARYSLQFTSNKMLRLLVTVINCNEQDCSELLRVTVDKTK